MPAIIRVTTCEPQPPTVAARNFRAISRAALHNLDLHELTNGWNIDTQMRAARAQLRICDMPMAIVSASAENPRPWARCEGP